MDFGERSGCEEMLFSTNFGPYFGLWKCGLISSDWPFLTTLALLVWVKLPLTAITVTEGSQSSLKLCVFRSVLVDGYAHSWSQGIFERWNWQKLAVLYFQIGKKVQQKGLKLKKLLGSFISRILRFSIIYAWYCISCASVKKKQHRE